MINGPSGICFLLYTLWRSNFSKETANYTFYSKSFWKSIEFCPCIQFPYIRVYRYVWSPLKGLNYLGSRTCHITRSQSPRWNLILRRISTWCKMSRARPLYCKNWIVFYLVALESSENKRKKSHARHFALSGNPPLVYIFFGITAATSTKTDTLVEILIVESYITKYELLGLIYTIQLSYTIVRPEVCNVVIMSQFLLSIRSLK